MKVTNSDLVVNYVYLSALPRYLKVWRYHLIRLVSRLMLQILILSLSNYPNLKYDVIVSSLFASNLARRSKTQPNFFGHV